MTQRARSGRSTRASAAKLRTVAKVKEPKGQNTDGMNGGNQFSIVAVAASFRLRVIRDTGTRPARSPNLSTTRFRPTPRASASPFATPPTAKPAPSNSSYRTTAPAWIRSL